MRSFGIFVSFMVLCSSGCAAVPVACQIIKTADTACTMIEMVGSDGKVVQVPVTKEELQGFARLTAEKRAAEKRAAAEK
jgi:hypothetical protein